MTADIISISSSDSDADVDELRNLAIISMKKPVNFDNLKSLSYTNNQIKSESIHMEFINNPVPSPNPTCYQTEISSLKSSSLVFEGSKKPKLISNSNIVNITDNITDNSSFFFDIINIDQKESAKNLIKEEELKNKLLKVLNNKNTVNKISNNTKVEINAESYMDDSDEDHFDILTNISPKQIITDPNVLKYEKLISSVKDSISDTVNCINSLSNSIQDKLRMSKKISIQIENLKNQKVDLHKEISINRRKILDFNKIKRQKSLELLKYEQLKRKYVNRSLSRLNEDNLDSLSTTSAETNDSRVKSFQIDCNQIICPSWLNNQCINKMCIYQHPKLFSKSVHPKKIVKIKENDKVFLEESNPMEFLSKLQCEACSKPVLVSTLHLKDDWHCRSCCQHLVSLHEASEIIQQLLLIWHHLYKRYQLASNTVGIENRDPSILQNLSKCTQAIQAKLTCSQNLHLNLFELAARHVITSLHEESRFNEIINFLLSSKCSSNLVLFSSKLIENPIKLHELLKTSISYQIVQSRFDDHFSHLIKNFTLVSADIDFSLITQLMDWLKLSIELNTQNSHYSVISILTRSFLSNCLGYGFMPPLTLAMRELELGDQFWRENRPIIFNLVELYQSFSDVDEPGDVSYQPWMDNAIHQVIIRCLIVCNFFTGDEELALRISERYSTTNFSFYILHSKLSLHYNSPIGIENDKSRFVEHSYNKCQWLSINRSSESCIKLLENLPRQLLSDCINYCETSGLKQYQLLLGMDESELVQLSHDVLALRSSSSLWLCYIDLCVMTNQASEVTASLLYAVIYSLRLSSVMDMDHLIRVFASVVSRLGTINSADQYFNDVNWVLQSIDDKLKSYQPSKIGTIDYQYIIDIVNSIRFASLGQHQLVAWLAIIDFCQKRLVEKDIDLLFVEVAVHLSSTSLHNVSKHHIYNDDDNCSILRHIVACYPIRVPGPWVVLIDALIGLNTSLHLVIDACENSLAKFPTSKLLWHRYYGCAMATGDVELISRVRLGAERLGLNFSTE